MNNQEICEKGTMDISSVDKHGNSITIADVPCEFDSSGQVMVDPYEVQKAELRNIALAYDLEERDLWLLMLLRAKPGPFQEGYMSQKYKLNKMLFYLWKEIEKDGFGLATIHDKFEADKRGPVPVNLWDDLERLHKKRILDVTNGGKRGKYTVTVTLNDEGNKITSQIIERVPDIMVDAIVRIKQRIFPLTTTTLMERVHRDYPEWKAIYTIEDQD